MPRPNKSGLTPEVIRSLRNKTNPDTGKPFTKADIARMFDVTRQYVGWVINQYGGVEQTPREKARGMFPWIVPTYFNRSTPAMRLRDHLEYMVSGGKGMDDRKLTLLRGFYKKLAEEGLVVEYDPSIPPSEGIFTGRWAYRTREERDGDLLIRLNEYSRDLTAEERIVWRFPPVIP
jgi:hypothetical protein